jgi:hypothetical protein
MQLQAYSTTLLSLLPPSSPLLPNTLNHRIDFKVLREELASASEGQFALISRVEIRRRKIDKRALGIR